MSIASLLTEHGRMILTCQQSRIHRSIHSTQINIVLFCFPSFPHFRVATTTCSRLLMPKTLLQTRHPMWRRLRKQRSWVWQTLWRNASPMPRSTRLSRERSSFQPDPSPTFPQTSLRMGISAVRVQTISMISLISTKPWIWRIPSSSLNRLYPTVR